MAGERGEHSLVGRSRSNRTDQGLDGDGGRQSRHTGGEQPEPDAAAIDVDTVVHERLSGATALGSALLHWGWVGAAEWPQTRLRLRAYRAVPGATGARRSSGAIDRWPGQVEQPVVGSGGSPVVLRGRAPQAGLFGQLTAARPGDASG